MIFCPFFKNKIKRKEDNILMLEENDLYTKNFGKQWSTYNKIQIDSENNFKSFAIASICYDKCFCRRDRRLKKDY